jgi:surfactin synthase thioesterase subunit/acyl carrier protein
MVTKAETDKINPGTTFKNLGIDSLTTVQLRNLFQKDFDVSLTIKDFTKYATPKTFAWYLYDLIKLDNKRGPKVEAEKDPWFIKIKRSKSVEHQILMFHDAGGSSQLFNDWDVNLSDNYELIIVELPGHGNRLNEKPINDFELLMDIIIPKINKIINKPYSIYGHSMGGLLGFETASIMQSKYNKPAENLIISGTPYLYKYNNELINAIVRNNIPDEELRKLIPGINKNTDEELAAKIVHAIRADFELIYSYHYNDSIVLESNIIALHAEDDDRVQTKDVVRWELATSKEFFYRNFVGGHSFVYTLGKIVAGIINRAISKQDAKKTLLIKK